MSTVPSNIRVIMIDDHKHIHDAVTIALQSCEDIQVVAQGSNGLDALKLCEQYNPDVVLMDIVMPVMDGIEATKQLHTRFPHVKILALSSFQDDDSVRAMLKEGAVGYTLKHALKDNLPDAIRSIFSGNIVIAPEVSDLLIQDKKDVQKNQDFELTERELEVLRLIAQGMTNKQIAQQLIISPSTVKFHINNIIGKFGVETRTEAIVLAAKNNLV